MSDDLLDLTVLLKVGKRLSCKRAVDLQAIDEGGNGDEAVRLDILLELVVGLLVEDDGVVGLVLNCAAVSGNSGRSCSEERGIAVESRKSENKCRNLRWCQFRESCRCWTCAM